MAAGADKSAQRDTPGALNSAGYGARKLPFNQDE